MKVTRFYLTDHPKGAFTDDPEQVEAVLKQLGVQYRREDFEVVDNPERKVFFRLVSSL